jgi:hypothetical protein
MEERRTGALKVPIDPYGIYAWLQVHYHVALRAGGFDDLVPDEQWERLRRHVLRAGRVDDASVRETFDGIPEQRRCGILRWLRYRGWHEVVIGPDAPHATERFASDLVHRFRSGYVEASEPKDADLWRADTTEGQIIFLFSPAATQFSKALLDDFRSRPLPGEPDLRGFAQIKL